MTVGPIEKNDLSSCCSISQRFNPVHEQHRLLHTTLLLQRYFAARYGFCTVIPLWRHAGLILDLPGD